MQWFIDISPPHPQSGILASIIPTKPILATGSKRGVLRGMRALSTRQYREIAEEIRRLGDTKFSSLISSEQYFRLYRLIDDCLARGAKVLDWGCGTGHVSYFLLRRGYAVDAFSIEPSPLANKLLELYPEQFHFTLNPDARVTLPYEDGQFDAVLSVGVLEHVRECGGNEPGSLAEIARILKPGGVFICYHLPNRYSWIDFFVRRISDEIHRHDYRYTQRQIEGMLADTALELHFCRRYGFLPRLPSRIAPQWLAHAKFPATAYGALDAVLSRALSVLDHNYCFVATKRTNAVH